MRFFTMMIVTKIKQPVALATLALMTTLGGLTMTAHAEGGTWERMHPVARQAAVGAAVGVGAGALSDRTSIMRGAATGAVTGVGTGLVSQSRYFRNRPLLRNTAQGAIVGTGTSYALRKDKVKGAAVGAGAGAGYHYLRKYMNDR
jgi:hypothetical protein